MTWSRYFIGLSMVEASLSQDDYLGCPQTWWVCLSYLVCYHFCCSSLVEYQREWLLQNWLLKFSHSSYQRLWRDSCFAALFQTQVLGLQNPASHCLAVIYHTCLLAVAALACSSQVVKAILLWMLISLSLLFACHHLLTVEACSGQIIYASLVVYHLFFLELAQCNCHWHLPMNLHLCACQF